MVGPMYREIGSITRLQRQFDQWKNEMGEFRDRAR